MKNFVKWFGIIAFVAVIGFSMAACGGNDNTPDPSEIPDVPDYTPITQIPDNYLNTYWSIDKIAVSVTFGSDAGKFSFYQIGQGTETYTVLSPVTKDEIAKGFDSGLQPAGRVVISFMNDGSKLHYAGMSEWVKR